MKTIIAGSRDCTDYSQLLVAVRLAKWEITEVVSGKARGVDLLGEQWATLHKVPIQPFPVTDEDYNKYGKGAPFIRNQRMADYGEALIALWDGHSSGTKDMINKAHKKGLTICIWRTDLQREEKVEVTPKLF
jgi:hypothetical protein